MEERIVSAQRLAYWMFRAAVGSLVSIASVHTAAGAPRDTFQVQDLTSSVAEPGIDQDTNLVNGWGLAASPVGPWWVSSNELRLAAILGANGQPGPMTIEIPGAPTGVVFNGGEEFVITDGVTSAPARFLFATEDGVIAGWSSRLPTASPGSQAQIALDNGSEGAVYKGIAIATTERGDRLYAADFAHGRVDVFDGGFRRVREPGAFEDVRVPEGFGPFNVQTLNGRVFVAYAKRDPATDDEVRGAGLGFVDVYDTEGRMIGRVATRGALDAPWGLAIAPPGFGDLAGHLLVGNFGDGKILAYRMTDDMHRFTPAGVLRDAARKPIVIDGLWGIAFGNGHLAGPPDVLFFAAGPHDEEFGMFGSVSTVP
jgi:uncharacterized protein (TIGR03118 family)